MGREFRGHNTLLTYEYDTNGNRIKKTGAGGVVTNYTYDDENRLIGVTKGTDVITYTYDPMGRRIEKNVNGTITTYVYDNAAILEEYNAAGNIKAKFTHGPGIDEPLAVKKHADIYYYHADGLGSIIALTDATGTVVETYSYDSFGNMTKTGNINQPFTYTAREHDGETGLYFYRARYYDPKAGRFISRDPIGFKGGINLYAYVKNNPINKTDPLGLYPGPCGNENSQWVPDYPLFFDFTWPCTEHDSCYSCAGARAGKSKAMCDLEFFGRMSMTCSRYPLLMSECMQMAVTYYTAVARSKDAEDSFRDSRKCCEK